MKKIVFAIAAAACAIPAMAGDAYVGGALGRSEQKLSVGDVSMSDTDVSYKMFSGYQFTSMFGAEIGYTKIGRSVIEQAGMRATIEPSSLYLAATATWPVTADLSVYGKLGVARTHSKLKAVYGADTETDSDNRTTAMFGLGASFPLTPNVSIFGEYENFGKILKDDDASLKADTFSVGLRYKF